MAILTILFWPIQWAIRKIRKQGIPKNARARRVIIVGLDGLEPSLTERYMQEGILPNLSSLKDSGSFSRLATTLPALSPVAWSSFQTGVNPGAHNIFDFLTRDKRSCLPQLASTEIRTRAHSSLKTILSKIGLKRLANSIKGGTKHSVAITRKSKPFWRILGDHGVFSNIIRVPISYPPEDFNGNILSAMCTPDIRGTQGSFAFFVENTEQLSSATGGDIKLFTKGSPAKDLSHEYKDSLCGELVGPPAPNSDASRHVQALTTPFELHLARSKRVAELRINEQRITLAADTFSPWVEVAFSHGRSKEIRGIVRFSLREIGPHFALYVSPINIHPEHPALPISHPAIFSSWLAKKHGLYGTLGLMEDTWGRNEHALDDARFLEQAYLTHQERERMFFEALDKTREGLCACVFDASDRIQHVFWRYIDPRHPAPLEDKEKFGGTIREMYIKMDDLIGRVRERLNRDDHLFVLSDHGFSSFRRGINLNTWLLQNGYLALKDDKKEGAEYLQDVDWSRTVAFAIGLSGIYINRRGREARGIVEPKDAARIKDEIAKKLSELRDPLDSEVAVRKVYDSSASYRGLYVGEAPDLIVGYAPGYRVSWESITGTVEGEIFSDNTKAWSGDHHIDPELIPGVLFSNRRVKSETPKIVDLAPTVLDLFGVKVPGYMEGQVLV